MALNNLTVGKYVKLTSYDLWDNTIGTNNSNTTAITGAANSTTGNNIAGSASYN